MAHPAARSPRFTAAMSASFSIETRDEETSMNSHRHHVSSVRAPSLGARALLGATLALLVAGCAGPAADVGSDPIHMDYRVRHPIVMKEGKQALALHVG